MGRSPHLYPGFPAAQALGETCTPTTCPYTPERALGAQSRQQGVKLPSLDLFYTVPKRPELQTPKQPRPLPGPAQVSSRALPSRLGCR